MSGYNKRRTRPIVRLPSVVAFFTSNMPTHEHVQTAQDYLTATDRELASGHVLPGSEKLWGSASHAVMAVGNKWPATPLSHCGLKLAVLRLTEEHNDEAFDSEFATAERFHANFFHQFNFFTSLLKTTNFETIQPSSAGSLIECSAGWLSKLSCVSSPRLHRRHTP